MPSHSPSASTVPRMRIRELLPKLYLGEYQPGPLNSLVDVPGLKVHLQEINGPDKSQSINTGVTYILPRDDWHRNVCYAGVCRFNGSGELTGSHFIAETGLLLSPIILTGSFGVGAAYQGTLEYAIKTLGPTVSDWQFLPVVGETYDGHLHDVTSLAVKPEHIVFGLENVHSEPVREGNVGGGVGMICHNFKGGTGSSSRILPIPDEEGRAKNYMIGALVQANYGRMADLRIAGVPVGRMLAAKATEEELERDKKPKDGSVIVVLATDIPMHPTQLERVARRATVGLSRVGGKGYNLSGDIFLAFSTGNHVPVRESESKTDGSSFSYFKSLNDMAINPVLEVAADVAEEAIYNALCMASTMTGHLGRRVEALPLDLVRDIMARYTEASSLNFA